VPAAYDDQPAANGPAGFRWRMQRLEDAVAEVPTGPRGETAAVGLFLGKTLGRWLIVLAIAAAALVLGYVGLTEYLSQPKVQGFGKGWADILCYDIQLFVLNAVPAQTAGLFPAALGIARFLAPAATAVATVETVLIDCAVISESAVAPDFAFCEAEIELLAEMEHRRWAQERQAQGYLYGPNREGKQHPDLVDWQYLSDGAKDKDREAIRELPAILHHAGFQILRLPPRSP
jgi:RyR domain